MRMRAAALMVVSLVLSGSARADFIVLDDARYVSIGGSTAEPSSGLLVWSDVLTAPTGSARQESTLAARAIYGTGRVDTTDPTTPGFSVFDVTFAVDEPTYISFFARGHTVNTPGASLEYKGTLSDSTGGVYDLDGFPLDGTLLLPEHEYRLVVGIFAVPDAIYTVPASWSFNIQAPVPEPSFAGLVLVALSLLSTAARARGRACR